MSRFRGIYRGGSASSGGGGGDIWSGIDGRANAPSGSAQFPTLLNTYHSGGVSDGRNRTGGTTAAAIAAGIYCPPWQVAGVDYLVGPPAGFTFKDPATINNGGETIADILLNNGGLSHVGGAGGTVNGYDFSGGSGFNYNTHFVVEPDASANWTFTNCKFSTGGISHRSAHGCIIRYCSFDGNTGTTIFDTTGATSTTTLTVEYCYLANFYQHVTENTAALSAFLCRFNFILDGGEEPTGSSHLNYHQWNGTSTPQYAATILFNTSVQHVEPCGGEGYQFYAGQNSELGNCTLISVPTGPTHSMSNMVNADADASTPLTWNCHDNYFDITGADAAFYPNNLHLNANATVTFTNNINMSSGATIAEP